jgi:PAS domain S-box-containing protein
VSQQSGRGAPSIMGTDVLKPALGNGLRYEAVLRLSEALSACREPEELTTILSEQLGEFLDFLQFYIVVYKENSTEVEWAVLGPEKSLVSVYSDVPVEERPSWWAYATQEPFHTADWNADERVPARLKQSLAAKGVEIGPLVFVPLTTPHRRLGALGMSGAPGTVYSSDDISFLRLIGRVLAFAIDDNFNLRRAEAAQAELQRQHDRLQRSERELREIIETIPCMAWSAAADGSAEFFNRRWLDYAGLSAGQVQGWGWMVAVHPDDLNTLVDYWRGVLASGQPAEIEGRLRRFDGVYRWFRFRATPSFDNDGRVVKWFGTNTDIAERKRAEEALRSNEQSLRLILDSIPGFVATLNVAGELELVNRRTLEYFGKTLEELKNWETSGAVHPDDVPNMIAVVRRAVETGQPLEEDHRSRRADGTYRWSQMRWLPQRDAEGYIVRWYSLVTDIDDRKRAEEALSVQNNRLQLLLKLTNRITSNLELREVLRAISANIREVMDCDAVHISLPDGASGKFRVYALDFPEGKGFVKEELLITPVGVAKRALEKLEPAVRSTTDRDEFPPDYYELLVAEGMKSQCVIPLVTHGRAFGVLAIARTTEDAFIPEDVDFLSEASGEIAIAIENALAYREISELKEKLAQEKLYLEQELRGDMDFEQIVGNSPALQHALQLVETVASSDSTVLLLGETGTGKELIARAIHDRSRRKDRTFVKVNCAAIPTGLLESELFGHEKGAFTGAITQKIGRLELADHGTLFLDEVGDIPIEIQPKLLRGLQEREFERLGSTHTRKVSVRLIAATNRDLEKMVGAREFRSDLYYRLNVFPIRIPPLRERKQDILC